MGVFNPLCEDDYKPDIHVTTRHLSSGTELSFCKPLALPGDSGGRHIPRWGNIVHYLLQQKTPQFVEDFYISSLTALTGRSSESPQLQIHYFHQDPEVDPFDPKTQGLWRKAVLEFTAPTAMKAECVNGQYTGGSVQEAEKGMLAGYVALPTRAFADRWFRFYSEDLGAALSVLLYSKELQPYDSLRCKDPFDCPAGGIDVSIRISEPTVRKMKIVLGLTEEIGSFFSRYKSPLEGALQEIQEAHKIQRDLVLSEFRENSPLFQTILERETKTIITEKLKMPNETLQMLAPQFPKSMLGYASLPT